MFVARPDDKPRAGLAHAVCHYRTSEENLMVFVFNGKAALGIEKSALSTVYPMRPARALPSRAQQAPLAREVPSCNLYISMPIPAARALSWASLESAMNPTP